MAVIHRTGSLDIVGKSDARPFETVVGNLG